MKRIGIYCRKGLSTEKSVKELIAWLTNQGYQIFRPPFAHELDLVIVLGGDGSLLRAARLIWPSEIPIFGINWGNLGFLTAVNKTKTYSALENVLKGRFDTKKRMTLEGKIITKQGKINGPFMALNEVVVEKGNYPHLITLSIDIEEEKLVLLQADGLIVATPTGSTAYSLSAGGPIVHPRLNALIITSICPFHLVHRALVLSPDYKVSIKVEQGGEGIRTLFDGQLSIGVGIDDLIEIKKSPNPIYLIENEGYFEALSQKLCWGC